MSEGYVYEQFGLWWVFMDPKARGPIHLSGPYRTREQAANALASLASTAQIKPAS